MGSERMPSRYQEYPVLFVDDQRENLRAFELAFRREFKIVTAASGSEALARLSDTPIAVVLSDHRMPGMTGTELLARAREVAPRAVRLLVTAYGDAGTLAEAINDGRIYRYIPKPWDQDEMRSIVRQSIDLYALEEERERLIAELRTLNEVSQRLSSFMELQPLISCLQRAVVEDLGFDGASVWIREGRECCLRWLGSLPEIEGLSPDQEAAVLSRGRSPEVFEILESRQAAVLSMFGGLGQTEELRWWMTLLSAEDVLLVPLHGRNGLLGAVAVDNRRGGAAFGQAEEDLLLGLASQAATAIENARLVGELRNDAARTSGSDALAIAAALGSSLEREVRCPLDIAVDRAGDPDIRDVVGALDVFAEILAEQGPRRCLLRERVERVRALIGRLVKEYDVQIQVKGLESVEVEVLPGRFLQLLLHLLEWVVPRSSGGVLRIVGHGNEAPVLSLIGENSPTERLGQETDCVPDPLGSVALGALLRELGASISCSVSGRTEEWRLALPGS